MTDELNNRAKLQQIRQRAARMTNDNSPALARAIADVSNHVAGNSFRMISQPAQPEQRKIVGDILKFKKGEWITDRGARVLPSGTEMIVRSVAESFCIFDGQVLVHEIFREPGIPFVTREEIATQLADRFPDFVTLDQNRWPLGPSGQPSDPTKQTFYLLLFYQSEMADFTFISSTWGGMRAVRHLSRQIAAQQDTMAGAEIYARVALAVGRRNSRKFGVILEPAFPINGWVDRGMRPLTEGGPGTQPLAGEGLAEVLGDDIA